MSLQDDFIDGVTSCMNSNFIFPTLTSRGLPNFALGCFLGTFAGINFVLQFIPPTPQNIINLSPPSINLFIDAFLGGINLPSSYPSITLGQLTLPGVGNPPYEYDLSGEIKLIAICILLPFLLILDMVTGLLNLQINLPTLNGIHAEFIILALEAGLSTPSVADFGLCLATAIFNLFTALI